MKQIIIISYFALAITSIAAYFDKTKTLLEFEMKINYSVEIGMSVKQVREILGSPTAVEGGFPESDIYFVKRMSKFYGQLVYSTWVYFYDPILEVTEITPGIHYFVNDIKTSKDLFETYKSLDVVYVFESEIIPPNMAEGYKLTKNPKLIELQKNTAKFIRKHHDGGEEIRKYIPIVCIIFEKGTQSVAEIKIYYIKENMSEPNYSYTPIEDSAADKEISTNEEFIFSDYKPEPVLIDILNTAKGMYLLVHQNDETPMKVGESYKLVSLALAEIMDTEYPEIGVAKVVQVNNEKVALKYELYDTNTVIDGEVKLKYR
jgi:hypothetical protein